MANYVPGELLVKFSSDVTLEGAKQALESLGLEFVKDVAFSLVGVVLARVPVGKEEELSIALSLIQSAQPNTTLCCAGELVPKESFPS